MAELDNEVRTFNELTALSACSLNASRVKSYGQGNGNTRNQEHDFYPSGQGRSIETCSYYHA